MISFSYCSFFLVCLFAVWMSWWEHFRPNSFNLITIALDIPPLMLPQQTRAAVAMRRSPPRSSSTRIIDETSPLASVTVSYWLRTETESTHMTRRSIPAELNIMSAVSQVKVVGLETMLNNMWFCSLICFEVQQQLFNYLNVIFKIRAFLTSGKSYWLLWTQLSSWNLDFHMRATNIHPWFSSFHDVDAILNVWTQSTAADSCEQMWAPHFLVRLAFFRCEQILSTCDNV